MKMLPVQLSLNPPLGLWSDVLWRCPPAPPSQLAELKTQLPASLPSDPRLWSREDVTVFLRFCEREFDLPKVDHDLFQMNGKALCLLTRADFGHRCPGAGDVLHNVLQMLIIESHMMQWHLPNSPVTPTSRYPLSPHSHPATPTWPPIAPPESPFHNAHMHHFMAPNSVTLSPPPSVDSQASSPPQGQDPNGGNTASAGGAVCNSSNCSSSSSSNGSGSGSGSVNGTGNGNGNGGGAITSMAGSMNMSASAFASTMGIGSASNQSDSDEESSYSESNNGASGSMAKNSAVAAAAAAAAVAAQYKSSPPTTPILKDIPQSLSQQITNSLVNSWAQSASQGHGQKMSTGAVGGGGSVSAPTTPSYMQSVKREFFPETNEPNTNGRLLWDFLQQLLNDRNQKYSDLIAWKCRDTGVFKIVDPAGLAKLWGIQKNHLSMNYDKMSRALRYYYRVNILRKVQGERHCYQFLRNPTELKNIKNISLLRQSVGGGSSGVGSGTAGSNNGSSSSSNSANQSGNQIASTNVNSTNWTLPHQGMGGMSGMSAAALQQVAAAAQQSPQRPSSRNNGNNSSSSSSNSNNNISNNSNNPHGASNVNLPSISNSAAAAAVAAAAAAAYGPPPTSPLFMHAAINGAFHYLSTTATTNTTVPNNSVLPPNSPALSSTASSEKFQFGTCSALKLESNSNSNSPESVEEMKPTDLSVAGCSFNSHGSSSEKRPYSTPSAEDCYPLIRNADGLTTIKLIRYNDNEPAMSSPSPSSSSASASTKMVSYNNHHPETVSGPSEGEQASGTSASISSMQQNGTTTERQSGTPTPMNTDSDGSSSAANTSDTYPDMPRDLRK